MKTLRLFGMIGLTAVLALSFTACSSDDDEPILEEEDEFIEGTKPKNLHVGMLYPISHDKKNDKCTFGLYLGENPPQDLIDAMEHQERVTLVMYDRIGTKYEGNYWDPNGFNVYDPATGYRVRFDRTITMSCAFCEICTKFCIRYITPTLFEYYPELTKMDNVELHLISSPGNPFDGKFIEGDITQSWSSPHHWYF